MEDCDERLSSALVDQFLGMIDETLPPPPELLEDAEAQKEEAVIKADEEGMRNLDKVKGPGECLQLGLTKSMVVF